MMTHSWMCQNCPDKSKLHYHACLYLSPSWALSWCWGHNVWAQFPTTCSPPPTRTCDLGNVIMPHFVRRLWASWQDVYALGMCMQCWQPSPINCTVDEEKDKPQHALERFLLSPGMQIWKRDGHTLGRFWAILSRGKALPNLNSHSGLFLLWQAKEWEGWNGRFQVTST